MTLVTRGAYPKTDELIFFGKRPKTALWYKGLKSATQIFGIKMTPPPSEVFLKFIRFGSTSRPLGKLGRGKCHFYWTKSTKVKMFMVAKMLTMMKNENVCLDPNSEELWGAGGRYEWEGGGLLGSYHYDELGYKGLKVVGLGYVMLCFVMLC